MLTTGAPMLSQLITLAGANTMARCEGAARSKMSGTDHSSFQPKATTPDGIKIEKAARAVLKGVLKQSIDDRREFGGVIYRDNNTGKVGWTGPFRGYASGRVDVQQDAENRGCPAGTTPVAWYHTHPVKEFYNIQNGMLITLHAEWDKFIGGDEDLSNNWGLTGYVATFDGRFWRYDPPPSTMINGKPTSEAFTKGTWGPLNGKL